jgi:PPP family 3-phenylpropionic acid transporter
LALAVTWSAQTPLTDSLALSGIRRFGANYTGMRIWGSISFLAANFVGGALMASYGVSSVPVMVSAGLAAALLASLAAPRLGRPRLASPLSATDIQEKAPKLLERSFVLFVAAAGVITGSHGFLYSFVSIYWTSIGIGETTIGLLWACGVFSEICLFIVFNRLFGRLSSHTVLVIAGCAALLRWLAYPWIHPLGLGVPGFFAAQVLHAFSVGLILIGLQKFIGETVAEHRNGAAQGIAFFANGLAMAAVTLVSGPIYQAFGPDGFHAMAAFVVVGFVLAAMAAISARRLK